METEQLCGIAVSRDCDEGYENFKNIFTEIWPKLLPEHQQTIREWLEGIDYSREGKDRLGVYCWGVADGQTQRIMLNSKAFQEQDTAFGGHLICHELAHAIQFAEAMFQTIPEPEQHRIELLWKRTRLEMHADDFAKVMGYPRTRQIDLQTRRLPTDASFEAVAKSWHFLTPEQKLAFARRASDIRYESDN